MKFDALKRDSAQSKAYIMSETEYVAENMSVRGAGSVAEADAADHFAEKLESLGFLPCPQIQMESAVFRPFSRLARLTG